MTFVTSIHVLYHVLDIVMITQREIRNCDTVKEWFDRDTCLISIRSHDASNKKLWYRADHVLQLNFDDVVWDDWSNEHVIWYHYKLFTKFDAMQIAKFIKFYNTCCKRIVFQCEAWISRSVWCCEAFLDHYFGPDVHSRFVKEHNCGNQFVRKILWQAFIYLDEQEWKTTAWASA